MKRIAIADDDSSERLILKAMLEDAGYSVVGEASDGGEAVRICGDTAPDVVLMDVSMPGKDGIEAATDISRECPVPVILLTARGDDETVRRAAEAGVMAYLVKPVREEELAPAIELAVSRFKEFDMLRRENIDLKKTIEARKIIEKAKGLLMDKEGLTEGEAFTRIRKISMDKRKTMAEIAEVIILAFEEKKR